LCKKNRQHPSIDITLSKVDASMLTSKSKHLINNKSGLILGLFLNHNRKVKNSIENVPDLRFLFFDYFNFGKTNITAMKKTFITFIITLLYIHVFAQNAKVIDSPSGAVISNAGGTDIPYSASILDIRSSNKGVLLPRMSTVSRDAIGSPQAGLLLFNSTTNQFNYHDGAAWQQAFFGNQWSVNGAKYYYNGGNVGIGVSDPLHKLHVNGNLHSTGFITTDGFVGIGGSPIYKLNVFDGSLAITNTADSKTWTINYNSTNNYLNLNENGIARMYFQNGGYVGIGLNPVYPLDVNGTIHSGGNLRADGSAYINGTAEIDGAAYVNGGKGVAYNVSSSTNIKIANFVTPEPAPFVLPAHGSVIFDIDLPAGFTNAPNVVVGGQHSTLGDAGELYRIILVVYNCTNTTCKGKAINTDNAAVDYWVRWRLTAIGN
jgi:hypothetical protein